MSGSHLTPVEQHLGDRLAALVDGELGHDARERVLAHLATCPKCKAEADAQRRLKSVFAEAAPPPPSESFLARLQGLPGGDGSGQGPFGGGRFGGPDVFGVSAEHALDTPDPLESNLPAPFGYVPSGLHAPVLPGGEYGFRIHDVSRREEERSASRGRRFAFVAAGAVSLAAIALGGVSAGVPTAGGSPGPGGGSPSNATPLRTPGPAMAADAVRRRSGTQPVARGSGRALPTPVTSVAASAPLLAGMPAPHRSPESGTASALTVTSSGATPFAPLIHLLPAFNEAPVVGALPGGALPGSAMEPVASAIQDTASGGAGAGMR